MSFKGWETIVLPTVSGNKEAVAPVIVSASRSTDLPAFYSEWFIKRWRAGYVKWVNPFNRQEQFVSFAKTRVIVFWTKNPRPLLKHLPELDRSGVNYYFTFTVNDYDIEGLEPNVPPLTERVEIFKRLSERVGPERVIWRFDPLILSKDLTVEKLLAKIEGVGELLHTYTKKLVISFADISVYDKVRRNLTSAGLTGFREFDSASMVQLAQGLEEINKEWGLALATCGEEVDLSEYGILHNKCIDDELMIRLFRHDQALMDFLGYQEPQERQPALFSVEKQEEPAKTNRLKDKGQRKACGCIVSKDIGQYNTCMHLCRYCYANYSEKLVKENYLKRRGDESESIL